MTRSDEIRSLAKQGLSTANIARRLGIRYQHAYNVLNSSGPPKQATAAQALIKPSLDAAVLVNGGFILSSRWRLAETLELKLEQPITKEVGVYAFAKDNIVLYVGVATMGLAKRLYFYAKPGSTQRTSQRLNEILKTELAVMDYIDIYTATPPDLEWNGLPVHGGAGLELGLIKKYSLPWNVRSAG
ncbi:GIY-YIG nuclease family protein [Bradyrhizobium sp. KB893862 SZCCT0404]|uniref:GIY-YIG nuclease family protein n=1 Tax=Bradyrhizobium sp. KB893862 SZCCT0404 TaxID=2807672 RepID=UPI001BAB79B4|nr:GIY-YIG nuclease family protein [Bradyrhizobium sp. KB893862 SZCCT0404]MBR1172857.1 GIY-YIG nuclease family protein [Bradyrhizobium sp. KB893862 SZCCT0404]